jgi:hypothetical protein
VRWSLMTATTLLLMGVPPALAQQPTPVQEPSFTRQEPSPPPEHLQRPQAQGSANVEKTSVVVKKDGEKIPASDAKSSAPTKRTVLSEPLPAHVITRYALGRTPDGDFCVREVTTRRDTPMTEAEGTENSEAIRFANAAGVARCPDEEGATRSVTPAEVAEPFVRIIPMPVPDPRIPPGHAITGLPAYLETRGTLSHRVGPAPTALGPIEVHATGAYYVDWGDGSPEEGPFPFEGEAHPTGRILHTYRDTGTYTVTVRVAWSADWRLGGDSGAVPGLQTEASIPLEVRQLQAVRLR